MIRRIQSARKKQQHPDMEPTDAEETDLLTGAS
jgi:hypothetical protein